jgi:hypothetical protein
MNTVALSQNVLTDLISDVLPLESGDVIKVRTSHQPSEVFVSYVENTTSVSGQSIDVLSDVDITTTAPTNGQTLVWNNSANEFQPGDAGGSTATLDDIGNVDTTGKAPNDVLLWNGSNWVDSNRLTELYTLLKQGSSKTLTAEPTNADTTEGFVELEATAAKIKVNKTGVEITETSPGDINLNVATDSSGATEFTAVHIDGQVSANEARVIIKQGALLAIEGGSSSQCTIRSTNSGNVSLNVPSSSGTIALDGDIPTNVTDLTDVTSAGSGAIITSAERTKLTGIATGATANDTDANLKDRANHTGSQTASTISDFDTEVANNTAVAANTAKNTYPSADATKLAGIAAGAEVNVIDAVVDDTTPQLGGDLDVQANKVTTTTTNGDVILEPNGTGLVQINGATNAGAIKLMCEAGTHGVSIASPPHSAAATYDLVLPTSAGSANQVLQTDGSGNLSWTAQTTGSDTNLGNTNLTANNNRTYDHDGNDLIFDPNGGEFQINDSSGLPSLAELQIGQGQTNIRGTSVDINGITYPSTDGTNGQVMTTDGAGNLSFQTVSGGGGSTVSLKGKFIIWAEENGALSTSTNSGYQWSFGNGDTPTVGLAIPFDCEATQMIYNAVTIGTSGTVNLHKGTSATSTTSTSVESISFGAVTSAVTTFTSPVSFSAGEWMTFRTTAVSGSWNDIRVGVVFEYDIADLTAYQGADGADGAQGPSGTSYDVVTLTGSTTLSSSHTTKYLVCNSTAGMSLTVPPSASYDTYAEFVIEQRGTGQVTIVAGSGVTIHSTETLKSGAQYAVLGLKRTDTNTYVLTGERETAP